MHDLIDWLGLGGLHVTLGLIAGIWIYAWLCYAFLTRTGWRPSRKDW